MRAIYIARICYIIGYIDAQKNGSIILPLCMYLK